MLSFTCAYGAQVVLEWDPNLPTPDGYKVFYRIEGQVYNYNNPAWTGSESTCTITELENNQSYYFVVRAFDGESESGDSNEVHYYADSENNSAAQPELDFPVNNFLVPLSPSLITHPFDDSDNFQHTKTRWQISLEPYFSSYIMDITSTVYLDSLPIFDLILEPDTTYFWRVKFFDDYGSETVWSETGNFITESFENSDDTDSNGISDLQEIQGYSDLDGNGQDDASQNDILCFNTASGDAQIGVKNNDSNNNISIVAVRSLEQPPYADFLNNSSGMVPSDFLSFKVYFTQNISQASITIYYSQPLSLDATWYNYSLNADDGGWHFDESAVISADRLSVSLTFEDGSLEDLDGCQNGVFVALAGPATQNLGLYQISDTNSDKPLTNIDQRGCFITALNHNNPPVSIFCRLSNKIKYLLSALKHSL